jgi:hypothetical protein
MQTDTKKSNGQASTGWFGLVRVLDVSDTLISKKGSAWRRLAVSADGKAYNFSEFPPQGEKLRPLEMGKTYRVEIFGLDSEKSDARGRVIELAN